MRRITVHARLAPEVHDALLQAATAEARSVNAQVNRYVLQGLQTDKIRIAKPKKGNAPGAATPEASVAVAPHQSGKEQSR